MNYLPLLYFFFNILFVFTFKTYNSQHSLHHPVLIGKPLCVLAVHFPVLFTNSNVVNRVVAPGGAPEVLSPLAVCSWCFWEYGGYPLGLLVHTVSGICGAGAGSDPSDAPESRQGCAGARMSPLRCEPPCRGSQHLWGLRAGPSLAVPGAREGSPSRGSEEEFGAPQPGTLSLSPRSLIRSVLQLGARISTLRRHVEHLFRSS